MSSIRNETIYSLVQSVKSISPSTRGNGFIIEFKNWIILDCVYAEAENAWTMYTNCNSTKEFDKVQTTEGVDKFNESTMLDIIQKFIMLDK